MPTYARAPLNYRTVTGRRSPAVDATLLYQLWYQMRNESHETLAAFEALVLRATHLGSIGEAWEELADRITPSRGDAWWAILVGRIGQRFSDCSLATDDGEAALVRRLTAAWRNAVAMAAPRWAPGAAVMPDLSRVRADLPLVARYQRLSPTAQVLLIHLTSAAGTTGIGSVSQVASAVSVGASELRSLVMELERAEWVHPVADEALASGILPALELCAFV
jgi:hypothetical protein